MPQESELRMAQNGLALIQQAVLSLLRKHPEGLRNSQVADLLSLRSDFMGRQNNYLSYSVLGGLIKSGDVVWDQKTKIFTAQR